MPPPSSNVNFLRAGYRRGIRKYFQSDGLFGQKRTGLAWGEGRGQGRLWAECRAGVGRAKGKESGALVGSPRQVADKRLSNGACI